MTTALREERGRAGTGAPAAGFRRALLPLAIVAGGLAVAFAVQAVFDPFRTHIPLCMVHALTGLDCPGCGALRAVHALLAGDPLLALRSNALIVLSLPLTAAAFAVWAVRRARGRTLRIEPSNRTVLVLGVLVAVYTVLRNLPGFWFLAPVSLVGA